MFTFELERFLEEDLGKDDDSCGIVPSLPAKARILCKEEGVLAGLEEAAQIYCYFGLDIETTACDGDRLSKGDVVMTIEGDARGILRAERLALNFLGRMSGIATLTAQCVSRAIGPKGSHVNVRVAATRKTTPGFRQFEKKAVKLGGGDAHRFDLSAAVMVKDNHIALLGLEKAIESAQAAASFTKKLEVEVESVEQGARAAELGADIVMFDNMRPAEIARGVKKLKRINPNLLIEASGGITVENIGQYAKAGVDVVSLGALTRNARWLDFGLEMEPER